MKTLQKPLKCQTAHCGAMCSPINAESCGENPERCFFYERRDDLYNNQIIFDKIKKDIEELDFDKYKITVGSNVLYAPNTIKQKIFEIIDKYKEGE